VVETLFFYDLTNTNLPMINVLAESYYWEDTTTLHIKLREGVKFHDGTDFDADAAKWNLDRLQYLINATGDNDGTVAQTKSLWSFPDGVTPIMDTITSDGLYNITITLNGPYAPFLATLSYINSGMISPTFHAAQEESFITLSDDIVGTGPFVFDSYTPDVEVRFSRFDEYWGNLLAGHGAYFPLVIYAIYDDANTAHNAFLSGAIDANAMASDQNIETYKTEDDIYVYEFTEDTGKPSLVYQYMGVNNEKYNATWRKAFAFAVNYTYIIEELRLGNAFRSYTAISPGYGAAFNDSLLTDPNVVPDDGDVAIAQATMQSMGYGTTFTTDAEWIAKANSGTPFATVTYTYNLGNTFRQDLGVAVTEWLKLIGVAVTDDGVEWSQFLNYLYDVTEPGNPDSGFDHLGIYGIGWAPDYLDPYNMLDPLFNNMSGSNSAQVNDPKLQTMMADALAETDATARNIIYKNIQGYMATQGFNHIPMYHSLVLGVHGGDIYGVPYNAMGALRIFPVYRGPFRA
jgi:peptide/nickel transport system substrate-binding protein